MALPGGPPTHTEKTPRSHLTATPLLLLLITALSKLVGMLRASLLASLCGVSEAASVLAVTRKIPTTCFDLLFGTAIPLSFVPKYLSSKQPSRFSRHFAAVYLLLTLLLSLAILLLARPLILLFFSEATQSEATQVEALLPISVLSLPLMGGVSFFCTLRQAKGDHLRPAAVSLLANLVLLVALWAIGSLQSSFPLALVTLLLPLSFAIQLFCVRISPGKRKTFGDQHAESFPWREYASALVGAAFLPISQLFALLFAARTPNGIATYDYAATLFQALAGVLTAGTVQYFFPKLAALPSHRQQTGIAEALAVSLALCAPIAVFVCLFSPEIITVFYRHGTFAAQDVAPVAERLSRLSLSLPALILSEFVGRDLRIRGHRIAALLPPLVGIISLFLLWLLGENDPAMAILLSYTAVAGVSLLFLIGRLPLSACHLRRPLFAAASVCLLYHIYHF